MLLIVLLGVGGTVGRFLFASVTGLIGRKHSFGLMYVGAAAMLVMWSMSTTAPALIVFALAFGAFYGGFVAIAPSLAADYFGGEGARARSSARSTAASPSAPCWARRSRATPTISSAPIPAPSWPAPRVCLVSFVITLLTPEPARWLAARTPSA